MILAERIGDKIRVDAPPTYKDIIKRVPGARYPGDGCWYVPLSWAACLQLRAELGEVLDVGPELNAWALQYQERRALVMQAHEAAFLLPTLDARLSPEQQRGATWLAYSGRSLLLDEMRSGKTPQVIEALEALGPDALPALFVVPNTMKYTWEAEFNEWAPGLTTQVVGGTATQRRKQIAAGADVTILNWESARAHTRLAPYGSIELTDVEKQRKELNEVGFKTVVADEAHRMVDPKAKQTRALWFLLHEAERRYLLTGTAIVNNGADLFSLWHGIAPEEAPVKSTWIDRYCIAGQGRFGWEVFGFKPDTQAEMFEILTPRMMRRTMREVRSGMPDRLPPEERRVMLEGKQAKIYKDLKKNMLAEIDGEILAVPDPLVLTTRLLQAAAATPVVEDGQVVALTTPSIKMDVLLETLEQNPGDPLVVFAVSRKLIELAERVLEKKGITFVSVHGGIDPQMRAANVARFQLGEAQVALCTTGAGAEGITLNRARRTLCLQRDWSANVRQAQAEARTDGKEDGPPIETIYSIVADTIEERVGTVGEIKTGYLQELVRDELRVK